MTIEELLRESLKERIRQELLALLEELGESDTPDVVSFKEEIRRMIEAA